MYQIGLTVAGGGICGVSLGKLEVIVRWYENAFVYACHCQGMSSSALAFEPVTVTNDVSGKSERMLLDLQNYDVKVTIPDSFVGWNKKINFTFEVFDQNTSDPIFKTTRRPLAVGTSLGGVNVTTTPTLVMHGTWATVEQKLREKVQRQVDSQTPFGNIYEFFSLSY